MTVHTIEVRLDTGADELIGLLGHRRPGWLRPFLLLAQRAVGSGRVGDVCYELAPLVDLEDGCHAAALQWRPDAGAVVFTSFAGRLVLRERTDHVVLAVDGDSTGGTDHVNVALLTRLLELLTDALAGATPIQR